MSSKKSFVDRAVIACVAVLSVLMLTPADARAQAHSAEEINGELHMEMTPVRRGAAADSARTSSMHAFRCPWRGGTST